MQILQEKPLGSWPAYDFEPLQQILKPAYEESEGKMMNMYAHFLGGFFSKRCLRNCKLAKAISDG